MNQTQRSLEIVRQTAELLSLGVPLSEMFERFCLMLAQFVDASVVFIAITQGEAAYLEFVYDHGVSRRDAHVRIRANSQTHRVLQTGQSIRLASRDELTSPAVPLHIAGSHAEDSMSALFVPLRFGGSAIGVLSLQTSRINAYTDDDLRLLETCALYVAVSVHAELVQSEMQRLAHESALDAVTGVATRRVFDQRLTEDWARARRETTTMSLLLLDVDWFKLFNDTYGHVAGDACLKQIAQAARATLDRETDLFARFGGEEFAAILWGTDVTGALRAAERMHAAVASLAIPNAQSANKHISISVGVATTVAFEENPDGLVQAADRALYAAKRSGRDRIVLDGGS